METRQTLLQWEREEPMRHGAVEYPTVIGVRLSREQADQLRQLARADDRPVSAIIRRLVTETLSKQQTKEVMGVR